MEDDVGETGAIRAAVRSAKKAIRPMKIGESQKSLPQTKKKRADKKSGPKAKSRNGGAFDKEMGQRGTTSGEGVRAKKGDIIGGMGKKKGGKPRKTK